LGLQEELDALAYPPTHTYKIDGLIPSGVLSERVAILDKIAPDFFKYDYAGQTFLDVGCNKGYFSLRAMKAGFFVNGVDTDKAYIDLCQRLAGDTGRISHFSHSSFRDLTLDNNYGYNKVFIGNAHHYLYRDAGWAWIPKLAAMCDDGADLIIEGPLDISCTDAARCLPKALHADFTERKFLYELNQYFDITKIVPTVSYTPDRYFVVAKARKQGINKALLKSMLGDLIPISTNPVFKTTVFKCEKGIAKIGEVGVMTEAHREFLEESVRATQISPRSNCVTSQIMDEENCWIGWLEDPINTIPLNRFECEDEVFRAVCDHNAFLAKNGYIDCDFGTTNWYRDDATGNLKYFDKNSCYPISAIDQSWWDLKDGHVFKTMEFSHGTLRQDRRVKLSEAMASKDPVILSKTFEELRDGK